MTVLLLTCGVLAFGPQGEQGGIDRRELAAYRLTTSVFERFRDASQRIAIVIARDPGFRAHPLFSQDVVQGGDVIEVSATLKERLRGHLDLSRALHAAKITPRDYTKFVLTVVAARLALGFLDSGVMRTVPPGAPTDNVDFVRRHRAEVDDLLIRLGIELGGPAEGTTNEVSATDSTCIIGALRTFGSFGVLDGSAAALPHHAGARTPRPGVTPRRCGHDVDTRHDHV